MWQVHRNLISYGVSNMKAIFLSAILIFSNLAQADINTAFLVVRVDIENELAKIGKKIYDVNLQEMDKYWEESKRVL